MNFTAADWQAIACALHIASGVYAVDALTAEKANQPRVAEQFRQQAQHATQLADSITREHG